MAKSGIGNLAKIALKGGRAIANGGGSVETSVVDIITFTEAAWGLQMSLFPIQRIILKAHYGIPLDDDPAKTFTITDFRRENELRFTEAGYLRYLYDQGRSNIREVVPGEERRNMILSIGRRSGKCVTGGTWILTENGFQQIQDLGDPEGSEFQPLEVGVHQEGNKRSASAFFYNGGVKPTVGYRTRHGFTLEGTGNHRVRVMGDAGVIRWKCLEDLQIGDQIGIHRNTDFWATQPVALQGFPHPEGMELPDTLDEMWGLILGSLVGGNWGLTQRLLGQEARLVQEFEAEWGQLLLALGHDSSQPPTLWGVPKTILESPKKVVCAFLRALFESLGGVEGQEIELTTVSSRLAHETQLLLLNLGILTRIQNKWDSRLERVFHLTLRGQASYDKFRDFVGFLSPHKTDNTHHLVCKHVTEEVPHQAPWIRKLVKALSSEGELTGNHVFLDSAPRYLGLGVTYTRIAEALAVARKANVGASLIQHFEKILEADYFFDPIVDLWEGEAPVFDLHVPVGESFVANGMTNHNTTISACIAAYETYKLINKGNPQKYYGLTPSNSIQLISVATGKDQAGLLYQEVSGHYSKCSFFKRFTANNTLSYARFQTPNDLENFGSYSENPKARASIKVTFQACNAKGLRGAGNIVIILDEVAHFVEAGGSSAEQVYDAVAPSAAGFTPKDDSGQPIQGKATPSDGRIILISSPLGKQGLFYKMFEIGKAGGAAAKNMLCIQAPTWEVNPTVSANVFLEAYAKDPNVFFTEFGGEFTDRTLGWLDNREDLMACVDPELKPRNRGDARRPYFVGFDLGLVGDASAIAICHLDDEQKVVLDYVGQIRAGEGEYSDKERLEFDDVADWIYGLSRKFYFQQGMFDQWNAIPLEQALAKRGLTSLKGEHMTAILNSQIYANFKSMIWDKKIRLYDISKEERERSLQTDGKQAKNHLPYLEELMELQAEYKSKYVIKVAAPKTAGKHDDTSDAIARAVWLASNAISTRKVIAGTVRNVNPHQRTISSAVRRKNHRNRLLGGSDPKRQIVKQRTR